MRKHALEMARHAGRLAAMSEKSRASQFDCSLEDVSDVFDNFQDNVYTMCEAAEISKQEMHDEFDVGYRAEKRKTKGEK